MEYIKAFNKEVLEIQKSNNQSFKKLIDQIPNKSNSDFYSLFDNLGSKLGMAWIAKPVSNKNYTILGYIPIIRYNPDNIVNETPGDFKLCENYVSMNECYRCLANAFTYKLMEMKNIPCEQKQI